MLKGHRVLSWDHVEGVGELGVCRETAQVVLEDTVVIGQEFGVDASEAKSLVEEDCDLTVHSQNLVADDFGEFRPELCWVHFHNGTSRC